MNKEEYSNRMRRDTRLIPTPLATGTNSHARDSSLSRYFLCIILYYIMSCHVMPRHATSCHVMPRHATSCHVMFDYIIFYLYLFFSFLLQGAHGILKHYSGSMARALVTIFPDIGLEKEKFSRGRG